MNSKRITYLAIGSVLWGAVFFLLFQMARKQEVEHGEPTASLDAAVKSDDEDNGLVTPKVTLPMWSKEGLPDFECVNQANQPVRKADLVGGPWIASFIFTRCAGTCPKVVNQLRVLQDRLADVPVRFVSFSVQPENDTPEVLARYAKNLGADEAKWLFLTGDKQVIDRLITTGFMQYVAPSRAPIPEPGWEVEHSNNVCLVDAKGVVVGKYNSLNDGEISLLRRDVAKLVATGSIDGKASEDAK